MLHKLSDPFNGETFVPVHVEGQSDDDVKDPALTYHFGDTGDRDIAIRCGNGFDRMGKHAEVIARGESDARLAVINSQCFDPIAHVEMLEKLVRELVDELFDLVGLVAVRDEKRIGGLHNDEIIHS